MQEYLWLLPLGFIIGAYGTLIGAGGGFVLMPVLLILYPTEGPEILASISLAVVFLNALSGSAAYHRMRRIDYKSGLLLSCATVPGAVIGALSTSYIPRRQFDIIFGLLMIAASVFLVARPEAGEAEGKHSGGKRFVRTIVDASGATYSFSYSLPLAMVISLFVGYISSLLGIGGGIIHVPVLTSLFCFPVHIATATSHFMLAIMSLAGTAVHIATGTFSHGVHRAIALGLGVLAGAQLGAYLSDLIRGAWIIRGLSIALGLAGLRILISAMTGSHGP